MHPKIADLIALQKLDVAIAAEARELAAIPGLVAGVDARSRALQEGLERNREALKEAQKRRRDLEGDLEMAKQRLSKYQGQLMEVKTNEAYRLMLKEIDTVKAEVAAREEKILEEMLRADELEGARRGGEADAEARRRALAEERAALEARRSAAEQRRRALEGERRAAAAKVGDLLSSYESIARSRGGVAVVEVRDELCLGCRVKVRPQVCQDVRMGTDVLHCDSCGRFLYFVDAPSGSAASDAPPA